MLMRLKQIPLIAILCMTLICGCKDYDPEYGAPITLRMTGVSGFPNLDPSIKFGLFVSEPVSADNLMMSVSTGGTVTAEKELRWGFNQKTQSRFFAYSPYDKSFSGQKTVTIAFPTDQSTTEKLLQANLLTAYALGGPDDKSVKLQVQHAMTALFIPFDNRTGERIVSVKAGRFRNVGTLDLLTGTVQAVGQTDVIIPMRCPGNDDLFCFLYPPQGVTPFFEVTLESGKTIGFDVLSNETSRLAEYPGKAIKLADIVITESTPSANIISNLSASLLPWTTNGMPSMPSGLRYISLKELMDINPESQPFSFLSNLNKVTVTAVELSGETVTGLVLEDSTRAVHVWTDGTVDLKAGNTIVGPVTGIMNRGADGELHISGFNPGLATIDETKVLPCTEGNFDSIIAEPGKFEYRRMLFRNVTLKEKFEGERAVFEQDGKQISVLCTNLDGVRLSAGVHGDLIGFPVRFGLDSYIMLFDSGSLEGFTKEYDESSLTRSWDYGWYEIQDPDTAVYVLNSPDPDFQYSVTYVGQDRVMQVMDVRRLESHLIFVYDCPGKPVEGHEYDVMMTCQGKLEKSIWNGAMECVKVVDDTAWFISDTGKYGLVMLL